MGFVGYLSPVLLESNYETCLRILTKSIIMNVSEIRLFEEIDSIHLTPAEVKQLAYFNSL